MGKVRVYELAKELGLANKELVLKLQEMGLAIKSHSSTLEDFLVQEIRERIKGKKAQTVADANARPTVIRRRKKEVPPQLEEGEPAEAEETEEEVSEEMEFPLEQPETEPVYVEVEPFVERPVVAEPPMPEAAEVLAESKPEPAPEVEERPEEEPEEALEAEARVEVEPEVVSPPEDAGVIEVRSAEEAEAAVEAADKSEIEAAEAEGVEAEMIEAEGIEAVAVGEEEESAETAEERARHKKKPKIKRIEKKTAEPAKIIFRPAPPEPPQPKPKPRLEPAPKPTPPPPQQQPPQQQPPQQQQQRPQQPPQQQRPRQQPQQPRKEIVLPPKEDLVPPPIADGKKAPKKKRSRGGDEEAARKPGRKREIIERAELYDAGGWDRGGRGRKGSRQVKKIKKTEITTPKASKRRIKVVDAITVAELAKKMGIKSGDIIKQLITMGVMANVNQSLDYDTAALVATEFGYELEKGAFDEEDFLHMVDVEETAKVFRPPVVTVMGHVDHGKTSVLDAIRKTHVIEGEAGGITQHIGAYYVMVGNRAVAFLDTPGHEAFTAMRARGAQVTDIVVLVVAADDGVMQQTREAADHAKAAGVPIIVAVNKIDKPEADPDRIRREVSDLGLVPEDWGGDTIFVNMSAKTGEGIDDLLEMILIQSEVLELKAPAVGRAYGHVVEARLDKGRGPLATVLIQGGKLKLNDPFVCGIYNGKIRAMFDDLGNRLEEAGPSMPVEIQGLTGVPQAGDEFVVVEDEKQAKQVSQHRQEKRRDRDLVQTSRLTLENLFDAVKEGATKELNLVIKTDVQGSLEAISDALVKMDTLEIKIHIIHSSIGGITESDIMLASASNALVIGFNVRANAKVQDLADQEKIQIRYYDIIYKLIEDVREAMTGMLEPVFVERVLGRAEVLVPFHISRLGTIAGSAVKDGKIVRGANVRLVRDGKVLYDGKIVSLKRQKDDIKEALVGYECGIGLENYDDIKEGDVIEAYVMDEIAGVLKPTGS